jgi:diaminopimelate epimerase
MAINFYKYQGTGNDFILVDNRTNTLEFSQQQIAHYCHRRFGIGADGFMLLELENGYDFKMVYYNADGNMSSMCGNGGRCITKFAYDLGIQKEQYNFIAIDGPHLASIDADGTVRLQMKNVTQVENHTQYDVLNTGSPHLVKRVENLDEYAVYAEGKAIRNSNAYKAEGINVNFVEGINQDTIFVRTYERGVEDETYSCGTGVTAAALISAHNELGFNHINIKTIGGNLFVEYDKLSDQVFENIWLCGPAKKVFEGQL